MDFREVKGQRRADPMNPSFIQIVSEETRSVVHSGLQMSFSVKGYHCTSAC